MSLNSDVIVTVRCYEIRSKHVHSSQTAAAIKDLEDLLRSCADPRLLFYESSIAPLKHIARCHGLPRTYSEPLRLALTNSQDMPKVALQLALLLKYAQAKDPDFSTIQDLLKLLENYPTQEVAGKKEFFVMEIVTQVLLTVCGLAHHAQFETVREELEACKSYLPYVNAKFRTQIKGSFERAGFWTSSQATYNDFDLRAGAGRDGEELIRSSHEKAASKVSAHAVKTQQTQAITTEENVSEKTQMQNINLSTALQQGRAKFSSNEQHAFVGEAKNKSGSDRTWWKTTSTEINNFLLSARRLNVVKDDDIIYLCDKFRGYKFSFRRRCHEMITMIAEIFALISTYQKLETSTVIQLLEEILRSKRSDGHYDRARQDILKTTENHCKRLHGNGHCFPEGIREILSKFKEDSSCTVSMERTIWRILMNDKGDPSINFDQTLKSLQDPQECPEALDYINEIVGREENWTKLESLGLISALVNIIIGSPKTKVEDLSGGMLDETIDKTAEPIALESVGFTSNSLWNRIPALKSLREDLTLSVSAVILDTLQLKMQSLKDRICQKEGAEDDVHAQSEYPTQVKIKALALLEEYLTLTGSQGLDVDIVVKFVDKSAAEDAGSELCSPIIRCVLHTLDKNAQNPPFFRHLPDSILAFLCTESCLNSDKKLQVFTLATLSNLLNNAEINQWIVKGIRHVDFLHDKLLSRDIIYHNNGRVILEEDLPEDFDFGENETSGDDRDFSCVSAIVARIFVATLQSERNICNESTISISMRALSTSSDKMTRIYCAEYLFGAAKSGKAFTLPVLNDLQTILFDTVADVRINARAAYCTALANLPKAPLDHICYLPNVYSLKTVLLGDEDVTPWINEMILRVMRSGAEINVFPEPVFHVLTLVLNGACADSEESEAYSTVKLILETIETYCTVPGRAETLPAVTMDAVENLLLESDVFDEQCARIIERCMMANHWVSDAVLEEFAKYLLYSPETSLPFLKRLCFANENQDLSSAIFENMQMELIGLRLWPQAWANGPEFLKINKFEPANEKDLLHALMNYLANGKLLSPLNMSVLEYSLRTISNPLGDLALTKEEEEVTEIKKLVVECLTMAGANGQGLSKNVIELALSSRIQSSLLFDLAIALVQQNQQLPQNFMQQVFMMAENGTMDAQAIQLVMSMILRNFQLPSGVLRGYVQSILQVLEMEAITMDLLSSAVKLVEGPSGDGETVKLLKEAFLRAIETRDSSITGMGLKGLSLIDKDLISSEDIQRISDKSQDPALRAAIANFEANSNDKVWLPPDPKKVPQNLLQEIQSLIERTRLHRLKLEFPENWMRALKKLLVNDSAAAHLIEKTMDNSDMVLPIEMQVAEALCYGLLNAETDNIRTHCKGALCALIQRGANVEDFSKYLSMSNNDEDRKWELQMRGKEDKFLTDLHAWQLKPEEKFAQARLSQHLQDQNMRQVYYKEIAEAAQKVEKIFWNDVPELVHSCAENLLRTGKAIGACAEVIEDHILLSTDYPSCTVLVAYNLAVKIGRVDYLPQVVQKCTNLLSPKAPREFRNLALRIFNQASCQQQLPSGTMGAITSCITSDDPLIRGRSFAILLQQNRREGVQEWNQIYDLPLKRIHEEIFQQDLEFFVAVPNELNDAVILTVYSLETCDLRRLKRVPREQWCEILMASDLIQTFSRSIDEQIMMQPYAIKVAKFLKPSSWLDFVQDFHQLRTQNPQDSIAHLLALISHALEAANQDELTSIVNNLGFKENYLTDLVNSALSTLLESHVRGISHSIAEMTVHQLKSVLNVDHIYRVICTVKGAIKLEDLEDFLNFTQGCGPATSDLESILNEFENKDAGKLEDILQCLQLRLLMKYVPSAHVQFSNIENHFHALLNSGFSYHQLEDLSKMIKFNSNSFLSAQESRINALESVLFQMNNYDTCPEWFPVILKSMRECEDPRSWIHRCNNLTMERIFSGSQGMKTLENIWKELRELNPDMPSVFAESMARKISKGDFKSSVCPDVANICDWTEGKIRTWARAVKSHQATTYEALSVAKRAFFLFQNYHLTDVQTCAILCSLGNGSSKSKGRLLQVSTGSGKSTVIAIIAVIQALGGTQVDIYTSSPVLAERDSNEWAKFYGMFDLTCSHNGDKGSGYVRGGKVCYKKDVVYGDTSQFQFDALRDEYSGLRTRAGRTYQYAIVDEVDSMFIDDSSKLARLSSTFPGMDLLQIIYHLTWNRLHDVQRRLFALGTRMFYLEGRLNKSEEGFHSYHFVDEDGQIFRIANLARFVQQNHPEDLQFAKIIEIVGGIEEFVANHLKDYIQVLIGDKTFEGEDRREKVDLPKVIVKYARTQVKNWVESALTALTFQENVHYIVDDGQIKPVDFLTTGVVQSSTNWNNGLHQFLQIKHAIKITTETVTTSFLSNSAMFKKYGGRLIGFTGTLGSSSGVQVLRNVYRVETVIIPELYFKRFLRLRDKVCATYTEWLSAVLHSALHESAKSRGVLIICQTIKFSELLAEELRKRSQNQAQIKLYVRNGENQEKQVERIHPGDIIVATNLAGRGTDIKTVEVEKYGGLHVILTFLPDSLRVEEQAFGRTSRQGSKGSGQLIVISSAHAQDLTVMRDAAEREELASFVQGRLKVIDMKDKLFERFCKTYQEIRLYLRENPVDRAIVNGTASASKPKFAGETLTALELTILGAVEELWAVFLKRIDDGDLSLEDAWKAYENFENEIRQNHFAADSFLKRTGNCFYWIQFGNELYRRDGKSTDTAPGPDYYFKLAIEEEPEIAAGAYAGRAYVLLNRRNSAALSNSQDFKYKEESIELLTKALKIIYAEISLYTSAQMFLQNRSTHHVSSELFHQITSKIGLMGDFVRNLGDVLSTAQKSLRAVECTGVSSRFQATAHLLNHTKEVPFQDYKSYTLAMHDLSSRLDVSVIGITVTVDQAIDTINRAMQLDTKFSVGLQICNQNLQTLAQVFSSEDKEGSLTLSGLRFTDVEELATVSAKSFVLQFGGVITEVKKLVAQLNLSEFQVSFEESRTEMPIVYRKSTSKEDYTNGALTDTVKRTGDTTNEIIVSFDTFEKLKASANLLPKSCKLAITFNDIKFQEISIKWTILQKYNSNSIVVSNLKPNAAKKMITTMREKQVDFVLRLENLSLTLANFVLAHNEDRVQEEIIQHGLKSLSEQFSAEFIPLNEVRELSLRGIELMAKFNELPFVPWRSVISMGLLASVQVAVGGALVHTGLGAPLGLSLITEGMSDYVTTWRTYSNRNFDLMSFWQQKAVSLTISGATLGWGALKDGLKAATGVTGSAVNEVTKQAGELIVMRGKTMTEIVKVSAQKLNSSLVVRQILIQGAETAARVPLNSMVDSLVLFSFEQVRGDISAEINTTVDREFRGNNFVEALRTYRAIDSIGQKQLAVKISRWVNDLTNQSSIFDTVALPLCQGIFSDRKLLFSTFGMAFRFISTLRGLQEMVTAVKKVCNGIYSKICSENESNTPVQLVHFYCSVSVSSAQEIIAHTKFDPLEEFKVKKFPSKEFLDKHKVKLKDLEDLFDNLYCTKKNFKVEDNPEMIKIIKSVVDMLTTHLIRVANRQLTSPWATMAVGSMVAKISREIQSRFIVSDEHMSMDQELVLELKKRSPEDLSAEQREFLLLHDYPITIADQIRGLAKDHNVIFKKLEMVAQTLQVNTTSSTSLKPPSKQTRAAIVNVLSGGPADVSTVFLLAKLNGINIKVVDYTYEPTEEDKKKGLSIIVFQESIIPGGLGHYSLMDPETRNIMEFSSKENFDCAYDVLAEITKKSVADLRLQAAIFITENVETYERIQQSAQWIHDRYPQDACNLLMLGGASRVTNHQRTGVELQPLLNGEPIGEKSLYLKSVAQRYSLKKMGVNSKGEPEEYNDGTPPLYRSLRRKEAEWVNEMIKKYGNKCEFLFKTNNNTGGIAHPIGKRMATGHIGSKREGQVGRDTNLIMKPQSANILYNFVFERPLHEFYKAVHQFEDSSAAFVATQTDIEEYGMLVCRAGNDVLEVPFTPQFTVAVSLQNNTDPRVNELFHKHFRHLGPPINETYSFGITNVFPSEVIRPVRPVEPDSDLQPRVFDFPSSSSQ